MHGPDLDLKEMLAGWIAVFAICNPASYFLGAQQSGPRSKRCADNYQYYASHTEQGPRHQ
jgi:hypothetical protein